MQQFFSSDLSSFRSRGKSVLVVFGHSSDTQASSLGVWVSVFMAGQSSGPGRTRVSADRADWRKQVGAGLWGGLGSLGSMGIEAERVGTEFEC